MAGRRTDVLSSTVAPVLIPPPRGAQLAGSRELPASSDEPAKFMLHRFRRLAQSVQPRCVIVAGHTRLALDGDCSVTTHSLGLWLRRHLTILLPNDGRGFSHHFFFYTVGSQVLI